MLVIKNKGEVEHGALTLLGATSKEGDDTKIGFFGSGNKYAMATLLRHGIQFQIWSGIREVVVTTQDIPFRGEVYKQILVDGIPTSLTTRMGPNWEVWFAIRELICNAIDEGDYSLSLGAVEPTEGYTFIAIKETSEVLDFYTNISRYILMDETLATVATPYGQVSIHPKQKHLNVYRKGISVISSNSWNSLYSYDFDNLSINESRVYSSEYELKRNMAAFYSATDNPDHVRQVLNANGYEKDLYWNGPFSDAWLEVLKDHPICERSYLLRMPPEDRFGVISVSDSLFSALQSHFDSLDYLGLESDCGWIEDTNPEPFLLAEVQKKVSELAYLGHEVTSPIHLGTFKGQQVMAAYSEGEIRLSKDYLADDLLLTIFEEHCHSLGYHDGSRSFELYLMKELLKVTEDLMDLKEDIVAVVNKA